MCTRWQPLKWLNMHKWEGSSQGDGSNIIPATYKRDTPQEAGTKGGRVGKKLSSTKPIKQSNLHWWAAIERVSTITQNNGNTTKNPCRIKRTWLTASNEFLPSRMPSNSVMCEAVSQPVLISISIPQISRSLISRRNIIESYSVNPTSNSYRTWSKRSICVTQLSWGHTPNRLDMHTTIR